PLVPPDANPPLFGSPPLTRHAAGPSIEERGPWRRPLLGLRCVWTAAARRGRRRGTHEIAHTCVGDSRCGGGRDGRRVRPDDAGAHRADGSARAVRDRALVRQDATTT